MLKRRKSGKYKGSSGKKFHGTKCGEFKCVNFAKLISRTQITQLMGSSRAIQWSGLGAFTAVSWSSIPGQGTKIPQAT